MIIKINKELKRPIYIQIADSIEASILEGKLKGGVRLPTEKELCDAYEISHSVVLNAYQILLEKDLIERVKGQGTYVKNHFKITLDLNSLFKLVLNHSDYEAFVVYHDTTLNKNIYGIAAREIRSEYKILSEQGIPFGLIKIYIDGKLVNEKEFTETILTELKAGNISVQSWFQGINIQSPDTFFFSENRSFPGYLITSEITKNNETKGIIKSFFHGKYVKVVEKREIIQL